MRSLIAVLLLLVATGARAQERPTPRDALRTFIEAGRAGDWETAGSVLDARALGPEAPAPAVLARQLKFVLDQNLWIEWERISDDPAGDPADGPRRDLVGEVPLGGGKIPVALTADQAGTWWIAPETVARIPALWAEHGPPWIASVLPAWMSGVRVVELEPWQWLGLLVALLAAALVGLVIAGIAAGVVQRLARRTSLRWDDVLIDRCRAPARFLLGLAAFELLVRPLNLAVPVQRVVDVLQNTLLLAGFAWLLLRAAAVIATVLEGHLAGPDADEMRTRGVRTQIRVLHRVAQVILIVIAGALVLLQFEVVRSVGVSLLASAGVAGLVLGLAAQRSIGSVLAGIQLSLTQPIRIGDSIVIEGEWGFVEEIHLTYVVVRVWDLRRLVIPISRFLEQPFQNWTKVSPEILGTVELFADYAVPVQVVREELERVVAASPLWDRRACGLQVTSASERTVTLRALISAANAGDAWNLRCEVREKMIGFLQGLEDGRYLPRVRVDGEGSAGAARDEAA